MEKYIVITLVLIILYFMIGLIIIYVIDNATYETLDTYEYVAIMLFYPVIGIIMGIVGSISLITKLYKELKDTIDEGDK